MNIPLSRLILLFCISALLCPVQGTAQWKKNTNLPAGYADGYWLDVFFLPANPQYGWVCGFNGKVLRTTDGGATWLGVQVTAGANLESIHFASPTVGYTSGGAGLFKSTDGGVTWMDVSPVSDGTLWGCYFADAATGLVIGGGCTGSYQRFYRTVDGGAHWTLYRDSVPDSGLTDLLLTSATGKGWAVSSGRLWQTQNGGVTWSVLDSTGPKAWNEEIAYAGGAFLLPVAGSSCGGSGGGGGMVFRTGDGMERRTFTTDTRMFGAFLLTAEKGWACGEKGAVYYTSDGGQNWQLRNCGAEAGNFDDIWFINKTSGWAVGDGVYQFLWPPYSLDRDTLSFGAVAVGDTATDTLVVYNYDGLATTFVPILQGDPGFDIVLAEPEVPGCDSVRLLVRFTPVQPGAAEAVCSIMTSDASLPLVLKGTGIQTVSVSEPAFARKSVAHAPEPFTDETAISYVVPEEKGRVAVRVEVFDVIGIPVATLVDSRQEAGPHTIVFHPSGALPAGVYFCRVTVGADVAVQRLTLMR